MRGRGYNAPPLSAAVPHNFRTGVVLFKLIGVIAGYYFWGFWGLLLGFFVGAFIDRVRAYGRGGANPLQNALRQAVFLETMFILMGKLAKADGRISQDEIDHV